MVICLLRGADLHIAQLLSLPLTVSCFSKIQIGFTFLVPAHLGSPGKGPLNGCVCVYVCINAQQCQLTKRLARDNASDCVDMEQSRLSVLLRVSDFGGMQTDRGVDTIARRSVVSVLSPR